MLYVSLLLSVSLFSCQEFKKEREEWESDCDMSSYDDFKQDTVQQRELLACINQFMEADFRGKAVIRNDTLYYGWHKGELPTDSLILNILKAYDFYAFDFSQTAYFAKGSGFKFRSCGLMYVPRGLNLPNGVEKKRLLVKDASGKWYYVEGKF